MQRRLQEGHQCGTVSFFQRCPRENFNCGKYTNDKHIIFDKQISDVLPMICTQNHLIALRIFPFQHSRKSLGFDSFPDLLEKLETYCRTTFRYYLKHVEVIFFQFFPGRHKYLFIRKPNFLNMHQIKKIRI